MTRLTILEDATWIQALEDRRLVIFRLSPLRHQEDVEQGPPSAPTLPMSRFAMLEDMTRIQGEGGPKGISPKNGGSRG
jgi:hypothetical protein